jgi:hypothetical protein
VGRRAPPCQQSGFREDECSRAKGDHAGAAFVRLTKRQTESGRREDVGIAPAGDDDRIGPFESAETKWCVQEEAGLRPHRRAARGDEHELVPRRHDVAPIEAEHLARNREVERQSAFVDYGGYDMHS